jgi:hypothetical protein
VKGNNMTENKNLENLPVTGEEQWELEERMKIHHSYSKSRYPPMCIEPMPYERQRLNGQGMTPEERALRKQWLLDQYLKPHEPPNSVEALETMNLPVNPIKRMFRMPMDVTFRMLTPVIVSCVVSSVHPNSLCIKTSSPLSFSRVCLCSSSVCAFVKLINLQTSILTTDSDLS